MRDDTLPAINKANSAASAANGALIGFLGNVEGLKSEWRHRVLFYAGIPTAIAAVSALRGSTFSPDLSTWRLAVMCVSLGVPTWIFAGLVRHLVARLIGRPRAINVSTVGVAGLLALVFNYYLLSAQLTWFSGYFYGFDSLLNKDGFGLTDSLGTYLISPSAFYFLIFWVGANAALELVERNRMTQTLANKTIADEKEEHSTPAFFEKLSPESRRDLIAIQAQQHYILVITKSGRHLIHHRFGDAVKELRRCGLGQQVHRSFWISPDAIANVVRTDRSYKLVLVTGEVVPVSHRYRASLEDSGFLDLH